MKKTIISLIIILACLQTFGQKQDENNWQESSQDISLSASSLLLASTVNVSYNATWYGDWLHYGINVGGSFVLYEIVEYASAGLHSTFGVFLGRKVHHPELKIGISYTPWLVYTMTEYPDFASDFEFMPVLSLGYRYQKPGNDNYWRLFLSTGGLGFGMGWTL